MFSILQKKEISIWIIFLLSSAIAFNVDFKILSFGKKITIKVSAPLSLDLNRVISDIPVVLWETTLTVSESIETAESELVEVAHSLSRKEITEIK